MTEACGIRTCPLAKPFPYLGAAQQLAASHSPLAIRLSNSAATVTSRRRRPNNAERDAVSAVV